MIQPLGVVILFALGLTCSLPAKMGAKQGVTITYLKQAKINLQALLYLPTSEGPNPALIMIHEGGFRRLDRSCFAQYGSYYARKGYVVMSIDYRLVQQGGRYPNALKDCIHAVRWLKAHSKQYKVDKNRIALLGSSSGAYLATMVVLANGLPQDIQNGHGQYLDQDLLVKAVVSSFGWYNWKQCAWKGDGFIQRKLEKQASPIQYCGYARTPFLLFAGGRDRLFGSSQAEQFAACLRQKGKAVELHVKPNQDHAGICDIQSKLAQWELPIIDTFLARELNCNQKE